MSRYIDADKIVQIIEERMNDIASTYGENDEYVQAMDECINKIEDAPTADVKEVVHGEWIYDKDGNDWGIGAWRCSICRCKNNNLGTQENFNPLMWIGGQLCPHCGADMRGEHNDE